MKPIVTVIGSSNTDMTIKSDELPGPGETILGGEFLMNPGGKGANQAVAAARLGGDVFFVAKTGNDIFGQNARKHYQEEGISTGLIAIDEKNPSGIALIMVDKEGENCISVASGANAALTIGDIKKAKEQIDKSAIVLMQLEIPLQVVEYIAKNKSEKNKIILNPAPAQELSSELLQKLFVLTPNISEAEILTGIKISGLKSIEKAAENLKNRGVENVIITLGKEGAYVLTNGVSKTVPPPAVDAVDSTAAGDTFNGALAVALGNDLEFIDAIKFANQAAALSVKKFGAQVSIPYRKEVIHS